MKLSIIVVSVYLLLLLIIGISIPACQSTAAQPHTVKPVVELFRVTVLENHTVSYITIDADKVRLYRAGDHVWVNLATHSIDDITDSSMKCRLHMTHSQLQRFGLK